MTKYRGVNKVSIDAFSSGSTPSSTIWTNLTGADVTIVSTQLDVLDRLVTGTGATPGVESKSNWDVTNKILAFKWRTPTGTHTTSTELDFEVDDETNTSYLGLAMMIGQGTGNSSQFYGNGNVDVTDTSVWTSGMGLDLADSTWVGLGFLDGNKLRCFKSTDDGATWTLFHETAYTGTFDKTKAQIYFSNYHTTSTDNAGWHVRADEFALFSLRTAKVRVAGAWADANVKVRFNGAWVPALPHRRSGGAWV